MTPTFPIPPTESERAHPSVRQLATVALLLCVLSTAASLLNLDSWRSGGVTIMWPSNGFLLGVLLCAPRRHWPHYLALGYIVDLSVNLSLDMVQNGYLSWASPYLAGCNMLEVFIGALLLYKTISPNPDLTRRRQLFHLLAYGVVLAPAIASFLASFALTGQFSIPELHSFQQWFTADALGVAIVTPLYLSYHQREHFPDRTWLEIFTLFFVVCATSLLIFWQTRFPLLYLILPSLLVMGTRMRLAGSALGLLFVSIIGGFLTTHNHGPVALSTTISFTARCLQLQLFVSVAMLVLYIIEVLKAESSRLQFNLQTSETRFRLLAEVSHDIIVLTDLTGRRRYVSPAVTDVLGWEPGELHGGTDLEISHPDDIPALEELLVHCRDGRPTNILPYRCRKKDGAFLWVEANLRLYRDAVTNVPVGFVNVVRDISSRKAAEDKLSQAYQLVESLASVDGLTGLANRRRLDETMELQWSHALRDHTPLSLLIFDVDNFKPYNDLYGHLQGDACLRQIADAARAIVDRPPDLLARYGGEEFVAVLPGSDADTARSVAEQIRRAVERLGIPHEGNPHTCVTVSVGCATRAPYPDTSFDTLFTAADQALYQAKAGGRNRTEVAALQPTH
jgi:diguanylate cyclase (GGDEF)-like protein/PAS domain S-box-containing protein